MMKKIERFLCGLSCRRDFLELDDDISTMHYVLCSSISLKRGDMLLEKLVIARQIAARQNNVGLRFAIGSFTPLHFLACLLLKTFFRNG